MLNCIFKDYDKFLELTPFLNSSAALSPGSYIVLQEEFCDGYTYCKIGEVSDINRWSNRWIRICDIASKETIVDNNTKFV